jgi:hypothetical protein
MNEDDPRHGSYAGSIAGCFCDRCRTASIRYHKHLEYDHHRGIRRLVPSVGFQRRYQALQALGHTSVVIAAAMGSTPEAVREIAKHDGGRVRLSTHRRMVEVYGRLSMVLPPDHWTVDRLRRKAALRGWPVPMMWDDGDLDDPEAQPVGHHVEHDLLCTKMANRRRQCDCRLSVDPVVVERALSGQRVRASKAERRLIVARWEGDLTELAGLLGANVWRDVRDAG